MRLWWTTILCVACTDPPKSTQDTGDIVVIGDTGDIDVDADGDGHAATDDCNDDDSSIFPGADEVCDGVDNNCDGLIDNDATDAMVWYLDADGDGHGTATETASCEQPSGHVSNSDDCDDTTDTAHPGAEEVCDGVDNDCDGQADNDATDALIWYTDADGDGYGDAGLTATGCDQPDGFTDNPDDCDDTAPRAWAGADDVCDGIDNDCDSATGEAGVWFEDATGTGTDLTDRFSGAVSIEDAGTLFVCAGTWTVNLTLSLSGALDVVGVAGASQTVLDGDEAATVVTVEGGGDVSLSGLTLQNGLGSGRIDRYDAGGGLVCRDGGTLTGDDLSISGNRAAYYGGGITVEDDCTLSLRNTDIHGNSALYGAGVYAYDGDITLTDSTVTDNAAAFYGGGFSLGSTTTGTLTVLLEDTVVSGNEATYSNGGGIWMAGDTTVSCSASKKATAGFYDNSAAYYGGAVFLSGYDPVFASERCDFGEEGSAYDNSPQDIHIYSSFNYDDNESFSCIKGSCK